MHSYYKPEDLAKFEEIGKEALQLGKKIMRRIKKILTISLIANSYR